MNAKRIYVLAALAVVAILAITVGSPYYQRAKPAAFCESLAALSQRDLADFASNCDRVWRGQGGGATGDSIMTDTNMLSRLKILGRYPHHANLSSNGIVLHYLHLKHDCAMIEWGEGFSESGDERVWNLSAVHDDAGWQVLYRAGQTNGEQKH